MTICKNSEPNREDEFAKDGYSACCTEQNCMKGIGTKAYFIVKIGKPGEDSPELPELDLNQLQSIDSCEVVELPKEEAVKKYQNLKCYNCGV